MIRSVLLLLNMIGVIFFHTFFEGGVSVKINAPKEVTAGTDMHIQVTLKKGSLESFSRFQQDLPAGLEASSENSNSGDFTFQDKKIRLMWFRLPAEDEITFSYVIHVDQRLKGKFTLDGKFSYIEGNERKSVDAGQQSVTILPSPSIDRKLIVDINDFEKSVIPDLNINESKSLVCIRQKPNLPEGANDIFVNLLVCKQDKNSFAKIEEKIPEGYTAEGVDTKEGTFTFKNGIAKFQWMNLPSEPYFVVTYKLIPKENLKPKSLVLKGSFSYMEDDKTINNEVVEQNFNLRDINKTQVAGLMAQAKQTAAKNKKKNIVSVSSERDENDQPTTLITDLKTGITRKLSETDTVEGVTYRVQLAAGHKPVNVKSYFEKYKIEDPVYTEQHQGWKKYSIGSFKLYKDARDYRIHIWNTTTIGDAFVSAYNNEVRITVQEALMIGNQKWDK